MPNIYDFQPNLIHIGFLFFPPLVTHVIHQLTALDPYCSVPSEILINPMLMNPSIHSELHLQHIFDCCTLHLGQTLIFLNQ
jgi:hypothetical protein